MSQLLPPDSLNPIESHSTASHSNSWPLQGASSEPASVQPTAPTEPVIADLASVNGTHMIVPLASEDLPSCLERSSICTPHHSVSSPTNHSDIHDWPFLPPPQQLAQSSTSLPDVQVVETTIGQQQEEVRRALTRALSSEPPSWLDVISIGQAQDVDPTVLKAARSGPPAFLPHLRFTYDAPSALHLAVLHDKPEVLSLLLVRGADVNTRTRCGRTPLFAAVDSWGKGQRSNAIIETLLRWGADVNILDEMGNSALTVAVLQRNVRALHFVVEIGADISSVSRAGWTPLHEAAWQGDLEVTRWLVEKGAPVHAVTPDGRTAEELAVQGMFSDVSSYLKTKTRKR